MTTTNSSLIFAETDRFVIRRLKPDDVTTTYLSWFQDEQAKRYIVTSSEATSIKYLRNYVLEKNSNPRIVFCGIFERQTNKHIGNIKFEPIGTRSDTMDFGILIGDPEWRSKGVGNEVIRASGNELAKIGINKIYLGVQKQNLAAIKLYENVGFTHDSSDYLPVDDNGILMSWDISSLAIQKA